ncbi:secretion-regulating guanine nucleotide exchange factor-like, partial [Rhinophrynus dorsalis]
GSNSYGQLGHSNTNDAILPQHVVGFPDEWQVIKGISAGGGHSAIITDAGKLYVCGQNKDGQLGLSHTDDVPRFTLCMPIQSSRVAKVACGWDFTIILTECGDILSCGANAFGQLGRPQAGTCTIPQRVEIPDKKKIMDVAAGLRHSLALTERGEIFQWGTGLASHAKRFSPGKPVLSFLTALEPCKVSGLDHVRGKKVTAGSYHCVALTDGGDLYCALYTFTNTDKGELYVWGSNKHQQLLHTDSFLVLPQRIDAQQFLGEPIQAMWSGWTHLVAQTDSGKVFTWGRADYGQLGRRLDVQEKRDAGAAPVSVCEGPAWIPALTGASKIACGSEHNLAICGNELYSWGWNEHGMCGNGSETNKPIPAPVRIPSPVVVELVGCGAGHSMVLCRTSGYDGV